MVQVVLVHYVRYQEHLKHESRHPQQVCRSDVLRLQGMLAIVVKLMFRDLNSEVLALRSTHEDRHLAQWGNHVREVARRKQYLEDGQEANLVESPDSVQVFDLTTQNLKSWRKRSVRVVPPKQRSGKMIQKRTEALWPHYVLCAR